MSLEDDDTREMAPLRHCYGKLDLALFLVIGLTIGYIVGRVVVGWIQGMH